MEQDESEEESVAPEKPQPKVETRGQGKSKQSTTIPQRGRPPLNIGEDLKRQKTSD